MSDCCGKPQIYTWRDGPEPSQYCGDTAYSRTYPQVEGSPSGIQQSTFTYGHEPTPFITNQGDWTSVTRISGSGNRGFSDCGMAVRSDGTLWTWGSSPVNVAHQLMRGVYGYSTEMLQIGEDTDWLKVNGGLLLKQDGSMWSIGTNDRGALGLGVTPSSPGLGRYATPGGRFARADYSADTVWPEVYSRLSSSVRSVTPLWAEFTSWPVAWIEARSIDQATPRDPESGAGAVIETVWSGRIESIDVTSSGSGYTSVPTVTISPSVEADASSVAKAAVTGMTLSATKAFSVVSPGVGYTYATARDSRTGATATATIEGGQIKSWQITSEGVPAASPIFPSVVYITGDGVDAKAASILYPSGVTEIRLSDNGEVWTAKPIVTISGGGGQGATAVVSNIVGTIKQFNVVNPGSGYTTAYHSSQNTPYYKNFNRPPEGSRDRVLYVIASDGSTSSVAGIVNLWPASVHDLVFNILPDGMPAGNAISVYFNRDGQSPAIGWYLFGSGGTLVHAGDGYSVEPPAYLVYGGIAQPQLVSAGPWTDIDGQGADESGSVLNHGRSAIDSSGKLWWWGRSFGGGNTTYPTPVGQGVAIDVDPAAQMVSAVSGPYDVSVSLSVSPPDSPGGVQASGVAVGAFVSGSADYASLAYSYTYGLFRTTSIVPGLGYTTVPTVTSSPAGVPAVARLVGPASFTAVHRGLARDVNGQWWKVWSFAGGSTSPQFYIGTATKFSPDAYHNTWSSSLSTATPYTMRAAFVQDPGVGYKPGDKLRLVINKYSRQKNTGYFNNTTTVDYYTLLPAVQTHDIVPDSWEYAGDGSFPPQIIYGDIVSASIVSSTGSGATVQIVDLPSWNDVQPMAWATLHGGMQFTASGSSIAMPNWASLNYFYSPYSWGRGSESKSIDSYGWPTYGGGYRAGGLAGSVAYDKDWTLKSDGQISIPKESYSSPPIGQSGNLAIRTTSFGSGYTDPVRVELSQPPGVASAVATLNGSVVSIGVLDGGGGYRTPPAISIAGGASATAVIQGPVDAVSVTSGGSGYRLPPIVRFSQPGLSATATCTIDEAGGVTSVVVSDGGAYRAAPTVSFEPVPDLASVSVTSAGSGYTSAPEVRIVAGSGGGSGATAYCVLNASGGVGQVFVTNRGSGYYDTPKVLFIGGGGDGATAVAAVAAPGSGAAATATISGKMIFAKITNGGYGYQTAPAVSATASPTGMTPVLQARVLGPIQSVSITSSGAGYSSYPGPWPQVEGSYLNSTTSGGSISSLSVSSSGLYYNVPSITFFDTYGARADTNLMRRAVSVYGTQAASGTINKRSLAGKDFNLSAVGAVGGFSLVGYYGYGLAYSTPPTITVEDVAGSGCVLSPSWGSGGRLAGLNVLNPGGGYTVNARVSVRGGRRFVWDNAATATAVVNASGQVVAVNVITSGLGYNALPDVIISGGGGTGATAKVASFSYLAGGMGIATIAVTNGGSGYSHTPTVTIVDRNDISGFYSPDYMTSRLDVDLSAAVPEYAWQDVPQQRCLSVVEDFYIGISDWRFLPHYTDGWVEHIYIYNREYVGNRAYTASPSVTIYGAGGSGAAGQAKLVKWSPVFCDGAAVRIE